MEKSVAPYIHALRNKFGAKVDSVREGRNVVKYVLTNAKDVTLTAEGEKRGRKAGTKSKTAKAKVAKVKAPKAPKAAKPAKARKVKAPKVAKVFTPSEDTADEFESKRAVAPDADLTVTEFDDRELADLRDQLGI